ncbi:Tubulin like [Halogranum gelatinilyticum]|uniref:Tubulin like n=1 Tax=Halogranum gelatinilyticum TaxID=660521 RepID=A0A1G9XB95_9EURY|nr:tubulin-like doman-containing protein [Halogranum gelatinilyticum]SDM94004.1 Tubulin like [Halogranum gelatinilyticum]
MAVNNNGEYRAQIPDTIIGIGGGGKSVVYTLLDQDWILKEALEPRDDTATPGFNPVVVDSESGAGNNDDSLAKEYSERIDEFATSLGHNANSSELTYINTVEESSVQDTVSLTDGTPVNEIARASNLRSWWVDDSDRMIDTDDNFAEGVNRRRALSKAFFHGTRANRDPFNEVVNHAGTSVYIVVGLGGGTGSGTFLDLARRFDDNTSVHLFGILPGQNAGSQEDANAHAALSELEYLSLTDNLPFDNVVIVPFAPATDYGDFDEAVVNAMISHANIAEQGVINNHADFFNPGEGAAVKKFAPFTIAVPKTFHIDVPEIEEAAEKVESYVTRIEGALDTEEALYNRIESILLRPEDFAEERTGAFETGSLPGDVREAQDALRESLDGGSPESTLFQLDTGEAERLEERLNNLRSLLEKEIFDDLNFLGPAGLANKIDNTEDQLDVQREDVNDVEYFERLVDKLYRVFETLSVEDILDAGNRNVDQTDRELTKQLKREILLIGKRSTFLRALHVIEDDKPLRRGLQAAIGPKVENFAIVDDADRARRDLLSAESREQNCLEALESALTDSQDELERALEEWETSVEPDVDRLLYIDSHRDEIEELLAKLNRKIGQAVTDLKRPGNEAPARQPLDFDEFGKLNNMLKSAGGERVPQDAILTSLKNLSNMRRAKIEDEDGGGYIPFLGSNNNNSDPEGDYENALINVNDQLFDTEPEFQRSFDVTFVGEEAIESRLDDVDKARREAVEAILEDLDSYTQQTVGFEELVDDPSDLAKCEFDITLGLKRHQNDYKHTLKSELNRTFTETTTSSLLRDLTRSDDGQRGSSEIDNVVRQALSAAIVDPIQDSLESRRASLVDDQIRLSLFDSVRDLVNEEGKEFTNNRSIEISLDVSFSEQARAANPHKERISPHNRGTFVGYDDIEAADILDNDREMERLLAKFSQQATSIAAGDDIAPILNPSLRRHKGKKVSNASPYYEGQVIKSVFLSRAFGESQQANANLTLFNDELKNNGFDGIRFQENMEFYNEMQVAYGAPWDITMTTFVGGVFLDNLAPAGSVRSGYLQAYRGQRDEFGEDIIVRHVHGLDGHDKYLDLDFNEGAYVYRDELVNVLGDERDLFTLGNEDDIANELIEKYTVTRFDSPVPLEE